MRRVLPLLIGLLLAPLATHAQGVAPANRPWVMISGVTGVRVPFTTGGVILSDTSGVVAVPRQERGGNPFVGAEARVRLRGPVSLVGTGVFSEAGAGTFLVQDSTGLTPVLVQYYTGSRTLFGRLGVAVRVDPRPEAGENRVRPSTDVVVGAALVRDLGENHPALNLGFQGVLPLARGLEFTVGLEDYLVFWNEASNRAVLERVFAGTGSNGPVSAAPLYGTSNILLLRAGLTVHPF